MIDVIVRRKPQNTIPSKNALISFRISISSWCFSFRFGFNILFSFFFWKGERWVEGGRVAVLLGSV